MLRKLGNEVGVILVQDYYVMFIFVQYIYSRLDKSQIVVTSHTHTRIYLLSFLLLFRVLPPPGGFRLVGGVKQILRQRPDDWIPWSEI